MQEEKELAEENGSEHLKTHQKKDNVEKLQDTTDKIGECTISAATPHTSIKYSTHCADILNAQTEGLVIVSDFGLKMSATVIGKSLKRKAGNKFEKECTELVRSRKTPLKNFDVVHTCAGGELSSNIKYVIHTFLPAYTKTTADSYQHYLGDGYSTIFTYADNLKLTSLTLPILGTGKVGVPLEVSIHAFLQGYKVFKASGENNFLEDIYIVHNAPEVIREVNEYCQSFGSSDSTNLPCPRPFVYSSHYGHRKSHHLEKYVKFNEKLAIRFVTGDITSFSCDAIVLLTNKDLAHIGGIAKVVKEQAGAVFERECDKIRKRKRELMNLEIVHVSAGDLSPDIKNIVMAVLEKVSSDCESPDWFENQCQQLVVLYAKILKYVRSSIASPVKVLGMTLLGIGNPNICYRTCMAAFCKAVQKYSVYYGDDTTLEEIKMINIEENMTDKCYPLLSQLRDLGEEDVLGFTLGDCEEDLDRLFKI